ncbi:MAG: DUF4099 domain-containing protein, partial [Prevotellaceae bacterium]|nr:DUF4099 domain-containing protein [Prevotellaceae bacterium]
MSENQKTYIDEKLVNWKEFDKFGISFDFLKKSGGTEKLLDNKKTALLPVSIKLD